MFNIILAMDKNNGIGYKNKIPFNSSSDLKLFKDHTKNSILIVGNTTFLDLPNLESNNRTLFVVSRDNKNNKFTSIEDALHSASILVGKKEKEKIFIIGGAKIYNYVFANLFERIDKVYLSVFNDLYHCDTFVNFDKSKFVIENKEFYDKFTFYTLLPNKFNEEENYNDLVIDCLKNGDKRETRNGNVISIFGKTLTFDLTKSFPILTTKRIYFRGVIEELLFFLRGDTNTKLLEEKGVNIWKGNTNAEFLQKIGHDKIEGMMGPMYGYQFRYFNAEIDENTGKPKTKGYDQLEYVINTIKNDPTSRRIIMTSYNPLQANQGVLYPCHSICIQFYVRGEYIDMITFNRSQDLFHGLPFNITSAATMMHIIANITNKKVGKLIMNLGDCHIYESHIEHVKEQLLRFKFISPQLKINKKLENVNDISKLKYEDFELINYNCWSAIKADMIC